ncbi:hypothetical protein HPB51_007734 [Rhipicephalus microplus]|uniref:Endonuclease/exonuclease/phosphatase domain-containing protein n=1 Tax=Rhipicephalus microplus TaxID=6941 RepID=A0A9J6DTZ8_RHIMP|nr:hypothetical protein HPB51_007734 [Rhipicephalus microplus]
MAKADTSQENSTEDAQSQLVDMSTQAARGRDMSAHGTTRGINTSSAVKRSLEQSAGTAHESKVEGPPAKATPGRRSGLRARSNLPVDRPVGTPRDQQLTDDHWMAPETSSRELDVHDVRGLASRKKQAQVYRLLIDQDIDVLSVQETKVEGEEETRSMVLRFTSKYYAIECNTSEATGVCISASYRLRGSGRPDPGGAEYGWDWSASCRRPSANPGLWTPVCHVNGARTKGAWNVPGVYLLVLVRPLHENDVLTLRSVCGGLFLFSRNYYSTNARRELRPGVGASDIRRKLPTPYIPFVRETLTTEREYRDAPRPWPSRDVLPAVFWETE